MTSTLWQTAIDHIAAAPIPEWDQENVLAAVEVVVDKFSLADSFSTTLGVELAGDEPVPHVIDLLLRKERYYRIIDWKTKKPGKLTGDWESRERRSWQSKIYAAAAEAKYGREIFPLWYEIRGVTLEEKPKVKTIEFLLEHQDAVSGVEYLRGVTAMRQALIDRVSEPWTKNPAGCRVFGPMYACEFEPYCWEGRQMVEIINPYVDKLQKALSHSSAQEFLRCQERYRLLKTTDRPEEEETKPGTVFHEVMQKIYSPRVTA